MCRKNSSNLSWRLLAAALLIAASAGGVFFTGTAAACSHGTAGPCAQQAAAGWKTVIVDLREQKVQIQAKRYADRVKRHLRRSFTKHRQQFRRHLVRIEKRRRAHKRRRKARQFAAARRHAAKHVRKLRHAHRAKPVRAALKKPQRRKASGSRARFVVQWRSLLRHNARNDTLPPQQRAN
jgi:hypothetical protein